MKNLSGKYAARVLGSSGSSGSSGPLHKPLERFVSGSGATETATGSKNFFSVANEQPNDQQRRPSPPRRTGNHGGVARIAAAAAAVPGFIVI